MNKRKHKREKQAPYKRVLTLIAGCFYYSGLVKLNRSWRRTKQPSLIILNYHRAAGGDLRRHLLYLRRHYRILPLEVALEELYAQRSSKSEGRDRRTPLVLTFDDGYHDNYTHAFKLACELRAPITIFLVPGYIESGSHFWWLEAEQLVARAQVDEISIEGSTYHLDKSSGRVRLIQTIDRCLRYASSVIEREEFLVSLRKALAVPAIADGEEYATLLITWAEAREMEESGWVSFGAHTMHHPTLAALADFTEVQYEVSESRKVLGEQLGHPVSAFAYPIGLLQHIGGHGLLAVQQAKFDWALTTIFGFNTPQTNPFLLRRIVVDVDQHWIMIAAKASGIWSFFSRLCWKLITPLSKDIRKEHYSW